MLLQMFIGKMFIDSIEIDYSLMANNICKKQYQEKMAQVLYYRNSRAVKACSMAPVFYIDNVPSKMNDL